MTYGDWRAGTSYEVMSTDFLTRIDVFEAGRWARVVYLHWTEYRPEAQGFGYRVA